VLQNAPHSSQTISLTPQTFAPVPDAPAGRRRWTTGELTEIVAALAKLRTGDIARTLGVNPKALRAVLRRKGISLRALRDRAMREETSQGGGLLVRRPAGPSATYGAAALEELPDEACRWSLGDPARPDFAFCGAPVSGRWPYCPVHLAQAFQHGDDHVH
jgi:GcrA cell cycle regulator